VSDELEWVRVELDQMVISRLLAPFTPRDEELYCALNDRERDLLAVRPVPASACSGRA
jgi:hypothetical protein